jgi:hypothetical protein
MIISASHAAKTANNRRIDDIAGSIIYFAAINMGDNP